MAGFLRGCGLSSRPGSGQSSHRSTQENTKGRDCTRRAATRPLRGGARGTQIDAALATIGRLALVDLEASGGHDQLAELLESRSEEHTSELQSLMRISYAVFCLKKKKKTQQEI